MGDFKTKEEYFNEYGRDEFEYPVEQIVEVDFPKTDHRYFLIMESPNASVEESYYWILNQMVYDMGMAEVIKITDTYAASEHSTFFNVAMQRLGHNQDKVAQYLGTIGKMIKDLFQIVRELRIIDERLEIYYKSKKLDGFKYDNEEWEKERSKANEDSHEVSLKGYFVDMAEGGSKNPASVFGMAQQLQYTTLPDLFFTLHPKDDKDISEMVDKLSVNENLKWVLKRKLVNYLKWKKNTYKEIIARKTYQLKYFRQHYKVIKTYITWIKPYLRNISKLTVDSKKRNTPDLISAFEGALVEFEILGKYLPQDNSKVYACTNVHFLYRVMPQMNYHAEGYQRGPLHVGEIKIQLRSYAWTQEQIDAYQKMRDMEDLELIAEIENSLSDAMDALGEDIEKFLIEAGEWKPKEQPSETKKQPQNSISVSGILEPFSALLSNFSALIPKSNPSIMKKIRLKEKKVRQRALQK